MSENWERETIEKIALAGVQEQKRARRWGIFFKTLFFGYLFLIFIWSAGLFDTEETTIGGSTTHTALVELKGIIAPESDASADNIIEGLNNAFKNPHTKGVVLRINSPGGSPVQAGRIYDEIKKLRAKYPKVPLYAVVEDICASGGYYVAAAADQIYVDKGSLIGSIGVIMDHFGFTGAMEKLGVERRVLTAGENKAFLDPFSPRNPSHEQYAKVLLGEIHQQFIRVVREGRGKRLKETPDMFSGLVWSGEKSVELGLADHLGSIQSVAREVIKAEKIVDYSQEEDFTKRLAKRFGTEFKSSVQSWLFGATESQGAPRLR